MARGDLGGVELQKKILDLWEGFYKDQPDTQQTRLRCMLKAKCFDNLYNLFDMVAMSEADWTKLGVVGKVNVDVCKQIAALRPPDRNKMAAAAAPTPEPASKRGVAASSGAWDWQPEGHASRDPGPWAAWAGPVPPPPPVSDLPPVPPPPALPGVAERTLEVYRSRPPVMLLQNTNSCDHHQVPPANVWKLNPLKDFELRVTDDFLDATAIERVLQGTQTAKNVPCEEHNIWHFVGIPGAFWSGNRADKDDCLLFMRNYWPNNKVTRYVEIGCLKCGYRSNKILPWSTSKVEGVRSGAEELALVLNGLFPDV